MHRVLAVGAGSAVGAFVLSIMANVVMIRQQIEPILPGVDRPRLEVRLAEPVAPPAPTEPAASELDPDRRAISTRSAELPRELLDATDASPLAESFRDGHTATTKFLVDGTRSRRWLTETEVRVPCAEVDRALAAVRDPDVGTPDHCARFIERIGRVLERHGVEGVSGRDFVSRYPVERDVRVMVIYAGWIDDGDGETEIVVADAHAALVHPRSDFSKRRVAALDAVYRSMELGPYARDASEARTRGSERAEVWSAPAAR